MNGEPAPEPRRWLPGEAPDGIATVDGEPIDLHPVCGICRLALREDQASRCIRIDPLDLDPSETLEPGSYAACPDCVAKFKPRILRRIQAAGIVGPEVTVQTMGRNMLM